MAEDLKRVGLVFKSDGAVDFQKTLKDINSSVNENRTAFKLAQSQWDSSTKSVDKLKDRQKYLAQQTAVYSDKVKILEQQLAELENAEVRDERAIQKKTAQLNTAKASLNNYKRGLDEVTDQLKFGKAQIEEYSKKLESAGKKMTDVGKNLTTKVTAPITALGGLAIKSAMELDEGYDTIITKTGATGDALQGLNDVADEVFGSMPVEMADVGTAVGEVNTRFGSTGDELEDLSRKFLQFSEINGVDLNNSIGTVDKIMTQFGIDTNHTGEVLGMLTARSQETGIATDTLMGLVSSNSATFKELGFSVEESVNMLAMFEQNGVDSSTAMTGLKKSISNMAKQGIPASEALGMVIDSIKNATTETEAINTASEIFGTKGAVEMVSAIRDGRFSLDELSDSMANYGGLVQSTYEATLDPWDQMKQAINNVKLAGTDLAGSIFEVLAPIMDSVSLKIQEISTWFQTLDADEKNQIVTIGLVIAAIGPLIMVLGSVVGGIGKIIGGIGGVIDLFTTGLPNAIKFVSGAMDGLWKLMVANPIGAVITIIGALVAAFIYFWNTCESFREFWLNLWESIKEITKQTVDAVTNFFRNLWDNIKNVFEGIKNTATEKWNGMRASISSILQATRDVISNLLNSIKSTFSNIWNSIKSTVSNLMNGIRSTISDGINGARNVVSNVLNAIRDKFSSIFDSAKNIVRNSINAIKGFFNFSWSLPHIPLPHFSVSGSFSLKPLSVPHFGISWYAKGGILNKPTIFGMDGNGLLGGGEAGKEAVLPIHLLKDYIREENMANNGVLVKALKEALSELNLTAENNIYLGDRKLGEVVTDMVLRKMDSKATSLRMAKGW